MADCERRARSVPCFDHVARALRQDLNDVSSSANYYVTPEMCREIKHIDTGVNFVRFDQDLLSNDRWKKLCGPKNAEKHREDCIDSICTMRDHMADVKGRMKANQIHSGLDYQAREAHHKTMQDFKQMENEIVPQVGQSMGRIQEYCADLGVTDRYTGYRNNLNRGNVEPVVNAFSWLDNPHYKPPYTDLPVRGKNVGSYNSKFCTRHEAMLLSQKNANALTETHVAAIVSLKKFKEGFTIYIPLDRQLPDVGGESAPVTNTDENERVCLGPCKCRPKPPPKSIQEQCGINMVYPGLTEYVDRYQAPRHPAHTPDYVINPSPNYNIDGRVVAKPIHTVLSTDYNANFVWPDGGKIHLFPWLRK